MSFRKSCVSVVLLLAVSASAAPLPGWLGIGYVNQTRVERGKVVRSWLLIRHVLPGSPAERAGLRVGDLVTAIDGKPLRYTTESEAVAAMRRIRPGQRLRMAVARLDRRLVITVVAGPMPESARPLWQSSQPR